MVQKTKMNQERSKMSENSLKKCQEKFLCCKKLCRTYLSDIFVICEDFMTFLNFTNFQTFLDPARVNFLTFFHSRNKITKNNFEKSDIFTRNQPGLGTSFGCERKIEVKHISTM